jgi:membrane fusion protein (multidrug efflux system)
MVTMSTRTAEIQPTLLRRSESVAPTKPRRKALLVLPVLASLAAAAGITFVVLGRGKESTDDAAVEGRVASVSPRVSGKVAKVLVRDNQNVKAGDVLVELDDRDLAAKLAAARADLAAARAQLHSAESSLALTENEVSSSVAVARGGLTQAAAVGGTSRAAIEQARADVQAAQAQRALAASELARSQSLFSSGALAQSLYDTRKTALDSANAALAQAQARVASAEAGVGNFEGTLQAARGRWVAAQSGPARLQAALAQVELARARVDQSQAALDQAALNHEYARITADVAGVVSRRSVEVGQMVSPDRPLMAIVPLDDVWVVANFKEDQIAGMRPGARAEVEVDAFGSHRLTGHVDSLAGGTGSRFSLLPPDNASGNFTKVVQRVPVLIRLDAHPEVELRPGLSALATVFTK